MRTQEEIYNRIKEENDLFGFQDKVLIPYLDFDHAKEFLKEDTTSTQWKPKTEKDIILDMGEYMQFALEKVQDHRGLSAIRSINKMKAWLWLLKDEELLEFADQNRNYMQYGAPILRKIAEEYGMKLPLKEEWFENMSQGKKCQPGCNMGCR